MWRSSSPSLKRCHFAVRRQVWVRDMAVNTAGLLVVTDQGEAFTGYPSGRKSANILKDAGKDSNKGRCTSCWILLWGAGLGS